MMEFYEYLKTKFNDLEGAKEFYRRWLNDDQVVLKNMPIGFSARAMAGHISDALTGTKEYCSTPGMPFYETKHGIEIYEVFFEKEKMTII